MSANVLVKNANLELVLSLTKKLLSERSPAACACDHCMNDIAAIALNYLPPHYYVDADRVKEFGFLFSFSTVRVEHSVRDAIDRVIRNPRHDNNYCDQILL